MKIDVAVVGRFHSFDLARELKRHGLLHKLITTYPKFMANRFNINEDEVISYLYLELFNRYARKLPFIKIETVTNIANKLFSRHHVKHIADCDMFVGRSLSSLESIIEAKKQNKIAIVIRGSAHFSYQMDLLGSEFDRLNLELPYRYDAWQRELLEYELADYIQVNSSFVKRTFIAKGIPEKKIITVNTGVNLDEFKQEKKEDDVFRIIFSGAASIRKGYHYLLQAFYELDLPNCEVWHLGGIDNQDASMEPFFKKYKTDKWVLKGHKPQGELYKYYSQGSVLVLPSIEEGLAMVQAQAMACGLPLICTTNTGGEDFISEDGKEGFVIPIRDVEALKEKILFMYNNQDICKKMGQDAKQRISSGFTWQDYGDKLVKKYREIYEAHKS